MRGAFSTSSVAPAQRFSYWNDLVCDVFVRLECKSPAASAFSGSMETGVLGQLRIVDARSDAIEAERTRRQIAKGGEDDLLVSIQIDGESMVVQDGREAHLRPGDFALYDSERPYTLRMSANTRLVCLQFPREALLSRLAAPVPVATTVRGLGTGGLFVDLAKTLPARLAEIEPADGARVSEHAFDLLALAVGGTAGGVKALASGSEVTLARLKDIIGRRLRDPGLDPLRAAQLCGISVRHANRLLAQEGTSLERFIIASRLERCHRLLADPAHDRMSIGEVAFAWGFNDFSHFSRAFRARFGCSPKDVRTARRRTD